MIPPVWILLGIVSGSFFALTDRGVPGSFGVGVAFIAASIAFGVRRGRRGSTSVSGLTPWVESLTPATLAAAAVLLQGTFGRSPGAAAITADAWLWLSAAVSAARSGMRLQERARDSAAFAAELMRGPSVWLAPLTIALVALGIATVGNHWGAETLLVAVTAVKGWGEAGLSFSRRSTLPFARGSRGKLLL